ncbi:MAG: hypothetical protein LUC16_03230 [Coprobacillus sp.]|nr:hypothetical protein [Coprobacillus sp.]
MEITEVFSNYWYIFVGAAVIVLIAAIAVVFGISRHRKKESNVPLSEEDYTLNFVEALGGPTNIASIAFSGKKLIVELVDFRVFDKSLLSVLGVTSTTLEKHKLTITMDRDVKEVAKLLYPYIQGELV